jgi:hypothetical protein
MRVIVGSDQDGVGLGNRQRAQDDGVDDSEERCIGGDTNGKREKDRGREALIAPE